MVEVVISLTDGDKCGNHVVARSVLVIKRSLAKPMRKRVDAESRLEIKNGERY